MEAEDLRLAGWVGGAWQLKKVTATCLQMLVQEMRNKADRFTKEL